MILTSSCSREDTERGSFPPTRCEIELGGEEEEGKSLVDLILNRGIKNLISTKLDQLKRQNIPSRGSLFAPPKGRVH